MLITIFAEHRKKILIIKIVENELLVGINLMRAKKIRN